MIEIKDRRGEDEVAALSVAMLNELKVNSGKGDWGDIGFPAQVHELLYHSVKLALAANRGDTRCILEYAADVANHAMFIADNAGALLPELMDGEHAEQHATFSLGGWKDKVTEWVKQVLPGVDVSGILDY